MRSNTSRSISILILLIACACEARTPTEIPESFRIELGSLPDSMLIGDTLRPVAHVATLAGVRIDSAEARWTSENKGVLRVEGFRTVIAVGEGTANLTAMWGNISVKRRVTVTRYSAPARFDGIYTLHFENSSFRQCGRPESYWVSRTPTAVIEFMRDKPEYKPPDIRFNPSGQVRVAWTARYSGVGMYGHIGIYRREMVVDSVESVTAATSVACP